MNQLSAITFEAILDNETNELIDVKANLPQKSFLMLGSGGSHREISIIKDNENKLNDNILPVLLGVGLGHALKYLLSKTTTPIAIVEKEQELQKLTKVIENLPKHYKSRITFITDKNKQNALNAITKWQNKNNNKRLLTLPLSFYLRIDKDYYGFLREKIQISSKYNFWEHAISPRFINLKPKILLLTSKYFLIGELERACNDCNLDYKLLALNNDSIACEEFIESLLKLVISFKPDCIITLNHMGVDIEGVLMDLLTRLQLPLASWFVDNPHLIIHLYTRCISSWTTLFTYDADNVDSLKSFGFEHVFYLPLGTDPNRFKPQKNGLNEWNSNVSFVGNSMIHKVGGRLKSVKFSREMLIPFKKIAKDFMESEIRSVSEFLKFQYPDIFLLYNTLPNNEAKLAYETAITWQATRLYRNTCVKQLLPFKPLIVGDDGWKTEFRKEQNMPRLLPAINYYSDLPRFYGHSTINFNCTSKQMKGAVNQRIFDCPATNSFVLTDWREQMDLLFEKNEMAYYTTFDEIPEKVSFYLSHEKEREKIIKASRKRVLASHTWSHRLKVILEKMKDIYGLKIPNK